MSQIPAQQKKKRPQPSTPQLNHLQPFPLSNANINLNQNQQSNNNIIQQQQDIIDKQDIQQNQLQSKKRQRCSDLLQDNINEMQHKMFINNKRKQKIVQVDSAYQGIFLYKPGMQLPSLFHYANQSIKVIIASEYIKKTNPQILKRNIYGSQTYTSNSDCVCIAIHSGLINFNNFVNKKYQGVQIVFKVIKPKKNYIGTNKNGITSRTIKGYNGNALKPQTHKMLTSLGTIQSLQKYASNMHIPIGKTRLRSKPRNTSSIIPIPQTHIVFNMNNQPAYKYSILNLADKGLQKNQFIKRKLDNQVLYLQNQNNQKYQLTKSTPIYNIVLQNEGIEVFKFSKIKNPYEFDNDYFEIGHIPLDNKDIENVYNCIEWNQIAWGNQSIKVKDVLVKGLTSFKYYKRSGK